MDRGHWIIIAIIAVVAIGFAFSNTEIGKDLFSPRPGGSDFGGQQGQQGDGDDGGGGVNNCHPSYELIDGWCCDIDPPGSPGGEHTECYKPLPGFNPTPGEFPETTCEGLGTCNTEGETFNLDQWFVRVCADCPIETCGGFPRPNGYAKFTSVFQNVCVCDGGEWESQISCGAVTEKDCITIDEDVSCFEICGIWTDETIDIKIPQTTNTYTLGEGVCGSPLPPPDLPSCQEVIEGEDAPKEITDLDDNNQFTVCEVDPTIAV